VILNGQTMFQLIVGLALTVAATLAVAELVEDNPSAAKMVYEVGGHVANHIVESKGGRKIRH